MRNLIYLLVGGVLLLFSQACSERQGKNFNDVALVNQNGILFIKNGIEGGMTDIKASGLVITKSNNQQIIGLAKIMLDDHTRIVDELKRIGHDKQVSETDTISPAHEQMISALANKNGTAFDQAYLQMMTEDHTEAVKLYTTASANPDTDIKNYAAKNLPVIQLHLDKLKQLSPSK